MKAFASISGEYTLRVMRDGVCRQELVFPNLILDNGINYLFLNGDRSISHCCSGMVVGSGSSPATPSQVELEAMVGFSDYNSNKGQSYRFVEDDPLGPCYEMTTTNGFGVGAAAGNLTEVGVFNGYAGWPARQQLISRALITDASGQPTVVTVLPNESLDVTYRLRIYPDLTVTTGTVVLDGVSHNYQVIPRITSGKDDRNAADVFGSWLYWQGSAGNCGWYSRMDTPPTPLADGSNPVFGGWLDTANAMGTYTPGAFYRDRTTTYGVGRFGGATTNLQALDWRPQGSGGLRWTIWFETPVVVEPTQNLSLVFRSGLTRK